MKILCTLRWCKIILEFLQPEDLLPLVLLGLLTISNVIYLMLYALVILIPGVLKPMMLINGSKSQMVDLDHMSVLLLKEEVLMLNG